MARPVCPRCNSRKNWQKKSGTGLLSCRCGYIFEDYRNETSEVTEFTQRAMRKRTVKSTRAVKEKKSSANPILYHGDRARYHYFQCLQVLLRMQIKKLTELWNLPPEFEVICRDTWGLHLGLLQFPPPPEPFLHTQEQESPREASVAEKDEASAKTVTKQGGHDDKAEKVPESSDTESSSTPNDNNKEDAEDPEMDELLREASENESSASGGEEQDQSSKAKGASRQKRGRWRRDDSPAATICILVYSCWLMRIPVMYNDFISLIETYILPYLEPVRLLPQSLTRHLTKHAKQALSPHHAPTPVLLHTITSRLSKGCFERYGIFTPELNAAPILWRTVRHMGGTREYGRNHSTLYVVSKALGRYLELPLTLNAVSAPPAFRQSIKDPASHKSDNVPPEVALVATVVIGLKLIYGLDEKQVVPREDWDPAHTMPALEAYMTHLLTLDASDNKSNRKSLSPPSMADVQDEEESSLDAYLDFCERALLGRSGHASKGNSDLVAEYFPQQKSMEADAQAEFVLNTSLGVDDNRPVLAASQDSSNTKASLVRAGESYAMYSAQDVFGKLPDKYAIVLSRAARWSGVIEDDLSAVLERFERRLVRRWKRSKRRCKVQSEVEVESESDK